MGCNECKEYSGQNVSYIVFESAMARMERTVRRLWVVVILLIVLLVGSNLAWMVYESQYETIETTESYEVESENGHAVFNQNGEVNINGESKIQ